MSVPALPLTLIESLERRLVTAVTASTSSFTGTQQVQDWGGEWWEYSFEMAMTKGHDGRRLSAFLTALGGMRGRFLLPDPSIAQPDMTASPVVVGAGQSGTMLLTGGWAATAPALLCGDFFSLGSDENTRLYQVTADATADVAGLATLSFVPRLRSAPLSGAVLDVAAPAVALRLTAPVPTRIGRADSYRFSITAREAL
ncbi:hypothetical protein [Pseudogemmobacter sp. W21_MBD1_M6]|uniref:hypothetical protein n=1 Tax=Pseudogemmobacter sp. W21_MBD1_M6 TaxID=3240271 RepID=UPI003F9CD984